MADKSIYKLFNIEKAEALAVFLFLFQSVFLGIFYGALDVSAQALFLDVYPASMIPKVYIISGILGIILTSLYTRLQSKIKFSRFAVYNLAAIVILALLLRLGFRVLDKKILVWVIFIFFGPLCILSSLGFWGAVSRMFTLRQGKRIFGLVDSGQILGIIIASFGSTILLSFRFETRDLLYVSAFSIFLALVMQIIISRKFEFSTETRSETDEPVVEDSFFGLLKKKYVFFMATFVGIAVVAAFFVHYTFMSVTRDNYPDTTSFAKFLGAFGGTMMVFTLLIKTFVYSRLVKTYGLKITLMLSPIILSIFAIAAIILGSTMGYTSASPNFILFFLIVSLTKLMAKTLHDSVEIPSFKILYQSLNLRIRFSVQSRVDGTINEISALLSGLLLAGLVSLPFVKTIHFAYFLLVVLLVWLFIAARLYREYRGSLQASLAGYQKKEDGRSEINLQESLDSGARNGPPPTRIFALELARNLHLPIFQQDLTLLKSGSDTVSAKYLEYALPLSGLSLPGTADTPGERSGMHAGTDVEIFLKSETLIRSANPLDRIHAANSLLTMNHPEKSRLLKILLRDHDYHVRNAALLVSGKSGIPELVQVLIEHLNHPSCYSAAYNAISDMGEPALETMDINFYKTGIEESTQRRIIRLFGHIGGNKSKKLLLNKLDYFNRNISLQAISELRSLKPELFPEETRQVISALSGILGIMAWNLAARISLQESSKLPLLAQAIEEEIKRNYDSVMDLMALAYDERSVLLVKENLDSGTREGAGYALELMDLFVADEMKRFIFPVLEENSPAEKLNQLQDEYPVDKMNLNELLISLINKSCNEISDYTKLIALASMLELDDIRITDDLTAHLFNSNESIAETSAFVMHTIDPGYFNLCMQRLDPQKKDELSDQVVRIQHDEYESFVSLLQFLRKNSNLTSLSGEMIRKLAVLGEYKALKPNEQYALKSEKDTRSLVFVVQGSLWLGKNSERISIIDKQEAVWLFPYSLLGGDYFRFETETGCNFYIFDGTRIESLVFDFPEFATALLALIGDQSKQALVA